MPLEIKVTAGGNSYANPFVGEAGPPTHVKVDLSGLTTDEVDAHGYLKPGVPLKSTGVLASGAGGEFIYVVLSEAVKLPLATIPPTNTSLGNETGDCLVAAPTGGLINRDVAEDNLGRAYTANELAAFIAAGSQFSLTTT